jgi:acid phosphatase type 7
MEPITSKIPLMVIEGNHEIEPQGHGGEVTFASYLARFAVPSKESGSNTKFYYSFNAGGIHFIMLGAYIDYNRTGNNLSLVLFHHYIHLNMISNVVVLSLEPCRAHFL